MTKRAAKKRKVKPSWLIGLLIVTASMVFLAGISVLIYDRGYEEGVKHAERKYKQVEEKQKKLLTKITDIAAPQNDLVGRLQNVLSKERLEKIKERGKSLLESKREIDAKHEYESSVLGRPPSGPKREVVKLPLDKKISRPRLAIVIDDVSFPHDVKAIKSLKMPLTMSFLPPSPLHPDSAKLASQEKFYMVHLPLEAMHFSGEEPITLRVSDSKSTIAKRIKEIKALFPRVHYINNHTGSKFTSNKRAVNDLISVLNKEKIGFLDSRTTAETKVPEVMESLGKSYLGRDIFLDHESDIGYIEVQIQKAIEKAKQHGSAIAIGHPRKETLQALKNSATALQSVELVYINKVI